MKKMRKVIALVTCASALWVSAAHAVWSSDIVSESVAARGSSFRMTPVSHGSCAYFRFDPTSALYDDMVKVVLAAHLSGKKMGISHDSPDASGYCKVNEISMY
jgi:hypothetical protein